MQHRNRLITSSLLLELRQNAGKVGQDESMPAAVRQIDLLQLPIDRRESRHLQLSKNADLAIIDDPLNQNRQFLRQFFNQFQMHENGLVSLSACFCLSIVNPNDGLPQTLEGEDQLLTEIFVP